MKGNVHQTYLGHFIQLLIIGFLWMTGVLDAGYLNSLNEETLDWQEIRLKLFIPPRKSTR